MNQVRRLVLFAAAVPLVLLFTPAPVSAAPTTGTYGIIVGFEGHDDYARAGNGDVVALSIPDTAEAWMNADTKAAHGTGTLRHFNSAGRLLGTAHFTLDRLIQFDFYGCEDLGGFTGCGGRALLAVSIHPDASPTSTLPANLEVNCQVGSPPSGPHEDNEGATLNVKDFLNFNKHVPGPDGEFGENIYFPQ